jgi:hypothetical protein
VNVNVTLLAYKAPASLWVLWSSRSKSTKRVENGFPKWAGQFGLDFLQITQSGPKLKGLGYSRLIDLRFRLGPKVGVGASLGVM